MGLGGEVLDQTGEPAVVESAEGGKQQQDAHDEAVVADPVDHERLLAGVAGTLLVKIEADEGVGAEPDAFPAEEHHQVIVAQHENEHGEHEQVHVAEEAVEPGVLPHVTDREHVDEKPHAGDHQQHDRRQGIQQDRPLDLERNRAGRHGAGPVAGSGDVAALDPVEDELLHRPLLRGELGQLVAGGEAEDERRQHQPAGQGGDEVAVRLAPPGPLGDQPVQPVDRKAGQRQQGNEPQVGNGTIHVGSSASRGITISAGSCRRC